VVSSKPAATEIFNDISVSSLLLIVFYAASKPRPGAVRCYGPARRSRGQTTGIPKRRCLCVNQRFA
jgi:hypothetical protein